MGSAADHDPMSTAARSPSRLSWANWTRALRDDIAGLPRLIGSPAVIVPTLLVAISAAVLLFAVASSDESGNAVSVSPLGIVASVLALFFLGIPSPPPIAAVVLAGILARRSSWLAGGIAGLTGTLGALAVVLLLVPDSAGESVALLARIALTAFVQGLVIGAGFDVARLVLMPKGVPEESGDPSGTTLIRRYSAVDEVEAGTMLAIDGPHMAGRSYYPVARSWSRGSRSRWAFVIAPVLLLGGFIFTVNAPLVLLAGLAGIMAIVYLAAVKPAGTLRVTYEWLPEGPPLPTIGGDLLDTAGRLRTS